MRTVVLFTLLVAASPSAASDEQREALVREVSAVIERGLDRELIVSMATAWSAALIEDALSRQNSADMGGVADRALAKELTARVAGIYRHHLSSRESAESMIRSWVDATFTTDELRGMAEFARTDAGKKFFSSMPRLSVEFAKAAHEAVKSDVDEALVGSRAGEVMRHASIRKTAADMRTLATALEAYATDHNRYPSVGAVRDLKPLLSPTYIRHLPETDAWGRPFEYTASADGRRYRIVSGGADRVVDAASRVLAPPPEEQVMTRTLDDETGDIIYQDGWFYAAPASLIQTTQRPAGQYRVDPTAQRPTPPGYERVGGDVRPPRVIQRVEPVYPDEAKAARIMGIVIIETLIDTAGNVVDATVLKPLPLGLDAAALNAIRQWRFEPATKNGAPVPVVFTITMNFKLDSPPAP